MYTYSNSNLHYKYGVPITLTCWFDEVNTNDCDAPPFFISVMHDHIDSVPYHFYTAKECGTNPIKAHKISLQYGESISLI